MSVVINGSAGVTTNSGAVYDGIQSDTAQTATGTAVDFTGIPSWVKRITVMFSGISLNGTSSPLIQLGDSGGFETTGYLASSSAGASGVVTTAYTTGFGIRQTVAADTSSGSISFTNLTSNVWVGAGALTINGSSFCHVAGTKTLSDTLTQIRITTVNGTDTFDAGSINILYE